MEKELDIKTEDKKEKLYDLWVRRNPKFETKYERDVLRVLTDYGIGSTKHTEDKGKIIGAGYEVYIIAFFIGLYSKRKLPLSDDSKSLGQPIQFWGNLDSKKGRKAYPRLREYIFVALVARTDIDWLEVDKGNFSIRKAVDALIDTMEQYTNYGFEVIKDKLDVESSYFYNNTSFLDLFLDLTKADVSTNSINDDEMTESLD